MVLVGVRDSPKPSSSQVSFSFVSYTMACHSFGRSEPMRIPVIVHTAHLGRAIYESYDSAYESKSDSESSSSSLDVGSSPSPTPSPLRSVKCRWRDCGQCFSHLDELAAHVTSLHAHTGPGGLFFCGWEGCSRGERGFNARYKMLVHVRTHTNEKPHHCFQCDKSFSRAENLKIHARSHTGERPYICPIPGCGKAYSNSSDRFKHTRTHSVDKPYTCKVPGCGKRYTDPSSLRKHVKTYTHFPSTPDTAKTDITYDEEMEHEQIVPEANRPEEEIYSQMYGKVTYPCSIPDVRGYVSSWLGSELATGRQWEWQQHPTQFVTLRPLDEQDVPLDLTIHK